MESYCKQIEDQPVRTVLFLFKQCKGYRTMLNQHIHTSISDANGCLSTNTEMGIWSFWQNVRHCIVASEIVKMSTSGAASGENVVKMIVLSTRWIVNTEKIFNQIAFLYRLQNVSPLSGFGVLTVHSWGIVSLTMLTQVILHMTTVQSM